MHQDVKETDRRGREEGGGEHGEGRPATPREGGDRDHQDGGKRREPSFVLDRRDKERTESDPGERARVPPVQTVGQRRPEEQHSQGQGDFSRPDPVRIQRVKKRHGGDCSKSERARSAATPQPPVKRQERRDLDERKQKCQGVVVPASQEKGRARVEHRQAKRVLRMREPQREFSEEPVRDLSGAVNRLCLESPDREVIG